MLLFDNMDEKRSPIAPEPPIPAKTTWSISSKDISSKSELNADWAISGHLSYILYIPNLSTKSKSCCLVIYLEDLYNTYNDF